MVYLGLLVYVFVLYIRPSDWVTAVLFWPFEAVIIGVSLTFALLRGRREGTRTPVCVWFLALWVLAILASNVVNGSGQGLEVATVYLKRAIVFLFFFVAIDSTRKLRGLFTLIVILCGVLGVQAIYMMQHGYGWAGQGMYWGGRVRWVGLWDGANVLSLMFVMAVPFGLDMIFGRRGLVQMLIGAGSLMLIVNGLYLANSRGGYIALGLTLLVYFRTKIGWKGLVLAGLVVVVLFSLGPSRLAEIEGRDSSARTRVDMWSDGLEMLKAQPVFGVGKGQFLEHTRYKVAHNVLIQNIAETGLVGFFIWLGAVYVSFKSLWLVVRQGDRAGPALAAASGALLASFAGYMMASMFINTDFEPLYILMALCAVVFELARREQGLELDFEFGTEDLRNIFVLEIVSIFGMYVVTALISARG